VLGCLVSAEVWCGLNHHRGGLHSRLRLLDGSAASVAELSKGVSTDPVAASAATGVVVGLLQSRLGWLLHPLWQLPLL
jgi:hypothetical protein